MEKRIIEELAAIVSEKTGLRVGVDHVHESDRRYYYIPEADEGKPLFLHHYRGPYFLDIPKADWSKLAKGEITPAEYVDTAHWYFGYYWGGGSMVGGGYFTPLECTAGIHDKEKIYRIMRILACRGNFLASGYRPDEEHCRACDVADCPNSAVVEKAFPLYGNGLDLPDNRRDLFKAVDAFIQKEYGYELHGMCCGDAIPVDHIRLYPNYGERTFELYISDEMVKDLLYNPHIAGYNWDRQVEAMKIFVCKPHVGERKLIESPEDFESALHELGILDKWDEYEEKRRQWEEKRNNPEPPLEIDYDESEQDQPESLWTRFCNWLRGIFK